MRVAILGAGAGGCAAVVEQVQAGHDVQLWARSSETLRPHQEVGGVAFEGILGTGVARPSMMTTHLGNAIADADVVVVTLPTQSHGAVAEALVANGWPTDRLIILNPGHTGGALEFAETFRRLGQSDPTIVEFSTLTYVARKNRPNCVTISGRANKVKAAALGGGGKAVDRAAMLFPAATAVANVLACDLCNVNMVLHPPGAVLGGAWIEATAGNFTFYVDGMTDGVARTMRALDTERLAVAKAFGFELPNLIEEMKLIGTVEADIDDISDFRTAISGGIANQYITAPDSFEHRYYMEDFGHGLLPFLEFAAVAEVETPVASALYELSRVMTDKDYRESGRTAAAMGITGLSRAGLLEKVSTQ